MHASNLLAATAAFFSITASAKAVPERSEPRLDKRAEATAAWVTVDDNGQPETTYTPSYTSVDGTSSLDYPAPHDLTASVYTWTSWGKITTSTGEPPLPTADAKNGEGAFSRCYNKDGDVSPFCYPKNSSTLYTGNTYYVTWDPDHYEDGPSNVTRMVQVRLDWLNHTSGEWEKLKDDFNKRPAKWGYWNFYVDKKYLKAHGTHNISITLMSNLNNSADYDEDDKVKLYVDLANEPYGHQDDEPPNRDALIIALPVVLCSIFVILVGLCCWHRKTRSIGLGNIMSRSRHGYTGRSARRMFGGRKDNGIQLDTRGVPPPNQYHDAPRRSDESLGSLTNSPVDDNFRPQNGRNVFRDEVSRQERERR